MPLFRKTLHTKKIPDLDQIVEAFLKMREYSGNIRDLKQLVSRMCQRYIGHGPLTVGTIPMEERTPGTV